MSVCYVCNCIIFFTDYERNPGTQNQNLWVPRHRGRRGQQAHPKDKGKGPEPRLGVFTISSGLASAGRQIRTDRQSHRQTDRWLSVKPSALSLTLLSDSQTAELILRKSHWRVTRVSCFTGVNNCFPVFYCLPHFRRKCPWQLSEATWWSRWMGRRSEVASIRGAWQKVGSLWFTCRNERRKTPGLCPSCWNMFILHRSVQILLFFGIVQMDKQHLLIGLSHTWSHLTFPPTIVRAGQYM